MPKEAAGAEQGTPTESSSLKALIAKAQGSTWYKVAGAIVGVLVLVGALLGIPPLPLLGELYLDLNDAFKVLLSAGLAGALIVCVFVASSARNRLFLVVLACLSALPLVFLGTWPDEVEYTIVYDEESETMRPDDALLPATRLEDILKLRQLNEISEDTRFISLIELPTVRWRRVLESGFRPESPILSVREVINSSDDRFIDISASDFSLEVGSYIEAADLAREPQVIYFQSGYETAANELRRHLIQDRAATRVTLVGYHGATSPMLHSGGSVVIYLGSPQAFRDFSAQLSRTSFKASVAPHWLASQIETETESNSGRYVVVLSSPMKRIVEGDLSHWLNIIKLIRDAHAERADVRSAVESRTSPGKRIHEIRFELTDLRV